MYITGRDFTTSILGRVEIFHGEGMIDKQIAILSDTTILYVRDDQLLSCLSRDKNETNTN